MPAFNGKVISQTTFQRGDLWIYGSKVLLPRSFSIYGTSSLTQTETFVQLYFQ